ncbi:ABC transporter permease (plasmid) [Deinococcus taeanensis]|uniref:ABC transporter permease n=1 Tax=Deinococcus taeanensis TaxID=2737050 RepID=UPI001CDC02E7|nr:ABC transporter permease [Deinococcus taeanensis]UBV44607.1 ABC transporter permease [Deinococcus taeanensis]
MIGARPAPRAAARRPRLGGWEMALAGLLVLQLVTFSLVVSGFYSGAGGLLDMTTNFLPFGLVALGLVPVILTGGIDLSVGSVAGFSAVLMAVLWKKAGVHLEVAVPLALLAGGLLGALNGLLITRTRTEPLIITLATSFIVTSVTTALAGAEPPSGFPDAFNALGTGAVAGVPYQVLLFAALATAVSLLITRTRFGRSVVMVGYNRDATRYSGIDVDATVLRVYVLSGVMAALAGVVLAAYYSAVRSDMGDILLLTALTMVVLGGINIFGGEGSVLGAVMAVLILGFLRQGLLIAGFSDMVTTMVTGAILLLAITAKNVLGRPGPFLTTLQSRFARPSAPEERPMK